MNVKKLDEADLFNVARKIESAEARAEYLDQVCGDDEDLRGRVAQLLDAYDAQPGFLGSPAVNFVTIDWPVEAKIGTVVGQGQSITDRTRGFFGH